MTGKTPPPPSVVSASAASVQPDQEDDVAALAVKSEPSERAEAPPIIVVSTDHYLTRAFEMGADEEPPGVYEDFDRTDRQIRLYQVTEGDAFELLSGENAIGAMYGGAERDGARWAVLLLPDTFEF